MGERNRIIDIAKGLCIVLVVTGHYFPDGAPEWYVLMRQWIYLFHMPLFMFLSGYVYKRFGKESGYFDFILAKSKRLLVPYFFVSTVIISLKLIMGGDPSLENPVTPSSYLTMFYLPSAGYFLWFIWSLMTMFVIVPAFKGQRAIFVLLLLAIVLHYADFGFEFTKVFALNETKKMMMWFVFGCVSANIPANINRFLNTDCARFSTIIVFFAFSAIFFIRGGDRTAEFLLPYFGIAAVISLSSLLDRSKCKGFGRAVQVLGESSYVIYLLHTTFMGFTKSAMNHMHLSFSGNSGFAVCAFCVVATGVLLPLLIDRFVITGCPVLRFLFGYGRKSPANGNAA